MQRIRQVNLINLIHYGIVQGSAKRRASGLVSIASAIAYHFCLPLPAAFTQPGDAPFYRALYTRQAGSRSTLSSLSLPAATRSTRPRRLRSCRRARPWTRTRPPAAAPPGAAASSASSSSPPQSPTSSPFQTFSSLSFDQMMGWPHQNKLCTGLLQKMGPRLCEMARN